MPTAILEEGIQVAKQSLTTVFELVNRSNSQWVKRGTEKSPNPRHMNAPNTCLLPMRSRVSMGAGKGYRQTMYVIGANTHYMDDIQVVGLDGKMETKKGLRSQYPNLNEEYAKSVGLGIKFKFGKLDLKEYGDDPILLDFVNEHEDNTEGPFAKDRNDRRKSTQFNFKPLRLEEKSIKRLDTLDADAEALDMVKRLRKADSKGGFTYDTDRIDALLNIMDEGNGMKPGENSQKLEILVSMAKRNGAAFMDIVNSSMEEYKINIALAQGFKVLLVTSQEAKVTIGSKATEVFKFTDPKGKNNDEQLILFFMSKKGQPHYDAMVQETETQKALELKK